jgi:hypothetical protein
MQHAQGHRRKASTLLSSKPIEAFIDVNPSATPRSLPSIPVHATPTKPASQQQTDSSTPQQQTPIQLSPSPPSPVASINANQTVSFPVVPAAVSSPSVRSRIASKFGNVSAHQKLLGHVHRTWLHNKYSEKVEISSLRGKIVGLYFSSNWSLPCRTFSSLLSQVYLELSGEAALEATGKEKKFEVVWINFEPPQSIPHPGSASGLDNSATPQTAETAAVAAAAEEKTNHTDETASPTLRSPRSVVSAAASSPGSPRSVVSPRSAALSAKSPRSSAVSPRSSAAARVAGATAETSHSTVSVATSHMTFGLRLPVFERNTRRKIVRLFNLSSIPTLVLLDEIGRVITTHGVAALINRGGARGFPWKHERVLADRARRAFEEDILQIFASVDARRRLKIELADLERCLLAGGQLPPAAVHACAVHMMNDLSVPSIIASSPSAADEGGHGSAHAHNWPASSAGMHHHHTFSLSKDPQSSIAALQSSILQQPAAGSANGGSFHSRGPSSGLITSGSANFVTLQEWKHYFHRQARLYGSEFPLDGLRRMLGCSPSAGQQIEAAAREKDPMRTAGFDLLNRTAKDIPQGMYEVLRSEAEEGIQSHGRS